MHLRWDLRDLNPEAGTQTQPEHRLSGRIIPVSAEIFNDLSISGYSSILQTSTRPTVTQNKCHNKVNVKSAWIIKDDPDGDLRRNVTLVQTSSLLNR